MSTKIQIHLLIALSLGSVLISGAQAGGGSSGSKGGGAKGCLVQKMTEAAENRSTVSIETVLQIAQICDADPAVAGCLVEQNANGNPISEDLLVYCERSTEGSESLSE